MFSAGDTDSDRIDWTAAVFDFVKTTKILTPLHWLLLPDHTYCLVLGLILGVAECEAGLKGDWPSAGTKSLNLTGVPLTLLGAEGSYVERIISFKVADSTEGSGHTCGSIVFIQVKLLSRQMISETSGEGSTDAGTSGVCPQHTVNKTKRIKGTEVAYTARRATKSCKSCVVGHLWAIVVNALHMEHVCVVRSVLKSYQNYCRKILPRQRNRITSSASFSSKCFLHNPQVGGGNSLSCSQSLYVLIWHLKIPTKLEKYS